MPEDSPAPAAASACAAAIPAVCCDPPGSASWLPGGPCAGEAAWLLQWARHRGGSAEKPASSPGGTAVETDPCAHAAASGGRTLPAGSCGKGQGGKSFMAPARGSDKAPPLMGCGVPLSRAHLHHLPVPLLNPHTCGFSPCRSVRIWYYMDLWLKLPTGSWHHQNSQLIPSQGTHCRRLQTPSWSQEWSVLGSALPQHPALHPSQQKWDRQFLSTPGYTWEVISAKGGLRVITAPHKH